MAIIEIKIIPIGTKTASVSVPVSRAIAVLKKTKGINYQLTPMGTVIEGPSVGKLLALVQRMHQAALAGGIDRVVTFIELDERKDKRMTMSGKMQSLRQRLKQE